ncbi:hypothetical protein Agabi119p4_7642 [Agaricus bisporus var. burnettii]|uniref:Reverse transcriptase domain-containing protein n=3 Tax=Agaricus bisporus var. burnettii TaxID=192524 RepID=A0A8H7C7A5_AGABI|nr:hypothetical protein Agabi119p4_7642 [Agaricus bisporus var. burnettii]
MFKGFLASHPEHKQASSAAFEAFRVAERDRLIEVYKAESDWAESSISPETVDETVRPRLQSRYNELAKYRRMKIRVQDPAILEQIAMEQLPRDHPVPLLDNWIEDPILVEQYNDIVVDFIHYFHRARTLIDVSFDSAKEKMTKKTELRDTVMSDPDVAPTSSSIQSMVDKAIASATKKLLPGNQKKKGDDKVRLHLIRDLRKTFIFDSNSVLSEGKEEEESAPTGETDQRRPSSGKGREEEREEEWEWKEAGETVDYPDLFVTKQRKFEYNVASSYPDRLLTLSYPEARHFILYRTPLVVLEAARYRHSIHLVDCHVPDELAIHLSLGLKYLFPNRANKELISLAWTDFADRLRWRLNHELSTDPSEEDLFDPDYYIPPQSRAVAKGMGSIIEYGITCGARFVQETLSNMPSDETEDHSVTSLAPPVKRIRQYLEQQQLIVTITDKNLGCAVCSAAWIKEQELKLLNDPDNYEELSFMHVMELYEFKLREMEEIGELAESANEYAPQLADYLVSRSKSVRADYSKAVIPIFYAIPKIHKNPFKGRPIVPCHSVVQGTAAKFVSKSLKPLVEASPYICIGTKQLVLKLSKLNLPRYRWINGKWCKLHIVSGDVVAFYPHVPVEQAHTIAYDLWSEWSQNGENKHDIHRHSIFQRLLKRCMRAADSDLLMQHGGKYYRQKQGLAMGVASSPDLANLFGHYFESKWDKMNSNQMGFYTRYIDDTFALVYAETAEQAKEFMNELVFDGCTLEWSSSSSHMIFLDLIVYFDSEDRLQWKPYRKPLNHFERIPWISAHPTYVKRGTFLGELSRMATLSSTFSTFIESCKEVACIYIARGYPPGVINSWFKQNYKARWASRLREEPVARAEVLVLKSEYNPAWDYINAHQLEERMKQGWYSALEHFSIGDEKFDKTLRFPETSLVPRYSNADRRDGDLFEVHSFFGGNGNAGPYVRLDKTSLLGKKVIVSKKRTKNLFDLTTMWKHNVLEITDATEAGNEANSIRQVRSVLAPHFTQPSPPGVIRDWDPFDVEMTEALPL